MVYSFYTFSRQTKIYFTLLVPKFIDLVQMLEHKVLIKL